MTAPSSTHLVQHDAGETALSEIYARAREIGRRALDADQMRDARAPELSRPKGAGAGDDDERID
jgi:hypothetical protein